MIRSAAAAAGWAIPGVALLGAAAVAATRRWWSVAGTTPAERTMPLPGDELVPTAPLVTTRAIDIDATVPATWPWLVQIGQDRGGFYSHAWLENLVGCRMRNADRIVPEWQHRAVGDEVWMHPKAPTLRVAAIDPPHTLVLIGDSSPPGDGPGAGPGGDSRRRDATSWAFHLGPRPPGGARLLVRTRTDWRPGWWRAILWRAIVDPGHFVMERAMLRGIARRAARDEAAVSGGCPDDA